MNAQSTVVEINRVSVDLANVVDYSAPSPNYITLTGWCIPDEETVLVGVETLAGGRRTPSYFERVLRLNAKGHYEISEDAFLGSTPVHTFPEPVVLW